MVSQNDQDETIIAPKVSKAKDIPVTPVVPKEKNDFLTNFLAGKDDKIVPNKIDLKEIHQEPKAKSEPDLSFFDGVKRYEAPKRPNQITKPGTPAST